MSRRWVTSSGGALLVLLAPVVSSIMSIVLCYCWWCLLVLTGRGSPTASGRMTGPPCRRLGLSRRGSIKPDHICRPLPPHLPWRGGGHGTRRLEGVEGLLGDAPAGFLRSRPATDVDRAQLAGGDPGEDSALADAEMFANLLD